MTLKRFWALYTRDLLAGKGAAGMVTLIFILWYAFLVARLLSQGEPGTVVGLAAFPFSLVPVLGALAAFQVWQREWQGGSIHLTLALPLPGAALVGAKTLAALTESVFYAALAGVGYRVVIRLAAVSSALGVRSESGLQVTVSALVGAQNLLAVGLVGIVFFSAFLVLIQLAYLVSRLVGRATLLVVPAALAASLWACLRLGAGLAHLVSPYLPPLVLWNRLTVGPVEQIGSQVIGLGPLLVAALLGTGLVFLCGWLVERAVDA